MMGDFSIENLARPHVPGLHPYTPGLQPREAGWVKLNTNENPYPPSPRVGEAIRVASGSGELRLYPDPASGALREAIAAHHGVSPDQVCVGNGSDDILNLLVRVFGGDDAVTAFTRPSYSLYPVLVAINEGRSEVVEFDRSMELDVERLGALDANLLFLTSPNAPTGVGFANRSIEAVLARFRGLLVVDEAYADFAEENAVSLLKRFPNLCVVRTFSKSYSLAGLRVGYALGSPALVALLDRVRDSYNVNRLSQAGALAALADQDYHRGMLRRILKTRAEAQDLFRRLSWFTYPSQANFLFTEPVDSAGNRGPEVAKALYEFLANRKILVRHFPSHALTSGFLRITVGNDAEMKTLGEAIEAWQQSEQQT